MDDAFAEFEAELQSVDSEPPAKVRNLSGTIAAAAQPPSSTSSSSFIAPPVRPVTAPSTVGSGAAAVSTPIGHAVAAANAAGAAAGAAAAAASQVTSSGTTPHHAYISAAPTRALVPSATQQQQHPSNATQVYIDPYAANAPRHVQMPSMFQPQSAAASFTGVNVHVRPEEARARAMEAGITEEEYALSLKEQNKMESNRKKQMKKVKPNREAGGDVWFDPQLEEWDPNDFRIFVGDLGNEVSDEGLARAFAKYQSLLKARVVRNRKTLKSEGYGFVSFKDPNDFMTAMREMNGKYIGNRPVKLRKSTWDDRNARKAPPRGAAAAAPNSGASKKKK